MRRSYTVAAPFVVGALVFALAAAYPASSVHGSGTTGPKAPASVLPRSLGSGYRVRWTDRDRAIVLRVRDGSTCRPHVERETSTGPARIEVSLERPAGAVCRLAPRWWDLRLRPPVIRARHQPVTVQVDGARKNLNPPRA